MGDNFYIDFAFRLKHTRSMQKMTQEELGELIGRSRQSVQRYEDAKDKISGDTILKCAKALNTSVSYLCGEENAGTLNNFSQQGLFVASEIMALPNDKLRKSVYHLVRDINRICDDQDKSPS